MVLARLLDEISGLPDHHRFGRVTGVLGMLLEVGGAASTLTIGGRCDIVAKGDRRVPCEVVGFREGKALVMPFGALDGIGLGSMAEMAEETAAIFPCEAWLGRVVNAMGEPVDGKGPLPKGPIAYPIRNRPPPAHQRGRVQGKVDLGVRVINTFLTCCRGQRMGIFAGSGVGKSSMLSMFARYTNCDISVIGLIGERGRELQEFIEDDLGPCTPSASMRQNWGID